MLPPFPAAGHKPAACERDCQSALVTLPSFAFAARRDPLDRHARDAVACGISSRKYARSLDTLPEEIDERSVSKSSVSRRYVAMTAKQMTTWLTTPLGDRPFPIILIDGIVLGDHTVLIALASISRGRSAGSGCSGRRWTSPAVLLST